MSRLLISRNTDLKALQDDGYEVAVQAGHLVMRHVPYVNDRREPKYGTLISVLESPVFQSILNIQDSLKELKKQVVVLSNWAVVTLYS